MKYINILFTILFVFISCSDYDEQDFTVILPNAGEDQVIFTANSSTTIQLNATESYDVNGLGFDVEWKLDQSPEGSSVTLSDANSLTPTFEVTNETAGRFVWRLILTRGDQITQDITRVDINPANAQILLINTVDSNTAASLHVDLADISGEPVSAGNTDTTYYNIDLNVSSNTDGTVTLIVEFGSSTLTLNATLQALNSYTLYVIGTENSPELLLSQKKLNQNSLPSTFVGLDAVNLAPNINNVQFFIDATNIGYGILPVDILFSGLGLPDTFGTLNYKQNKEIIFPAQSLILLPIWATANGQRISNDALIDLPYGRDGNFGTFLLVADADSQYGNTLSFIDNSELLPQ